MPASTPTQLTLGMGLSDEARFANFLVSSGNRELVQLLQAAPPEPRFIYVRAQQGAGLSHLLQGACHAAGESDQPAQYLPLAEQAGFGPEILQGVSGLGLLCLDDLEAVAGLSDWERALFNAYNEIAHSRCRLVIGAHAAPSGLGLTLADLQSRLQQAPVFQLSRPDEGELREILLMRATRRGMRLNEAVVEFVLKRSERSLPGIMATLDRLDESSLTHRRALTIPLVKQTLGW